MSLYDRAKALQSARLSLPNSAAINFPLNGTMRPSISFMFFSAISKARVAFCSVEKTPATTQNLYAVFAAAVLAADAPAAAEPPDTAAADSDTAVEAVGDVWAAVSEVFEDTASAIASESPSTPCTAEIESAVTCAVISVCASLPTTLTPPKSFSPHIIYAPTHRATATHTPLTA